MRQKEKGVSVIKKCVAGIMLALVGLLCVLFLPAQEAYALGAEVVTRADSAIDQGILTVENQKVNWLQNKLFNMSDVEALLSLPEILEDTKSIMQGFKLQFNVDKATSMFFSKKSNDISVFLSGDGMENSFNKNFSDYLQTGGIQTKISQDGTVSYEESSSQDDVDIKERLDKGLTLSVAETLIDRSSTAIKASANATRESGDLDAIDSKGDESAEAYIKEVADYAPLVVPEVQEGIAQALWNSTAPENGLTRNMTTFDIAQQSKHRMLNGIASITAKYTDAEKSYRAGLNTAIDGYDKTLSEAAALKDDAAPSKGIKVIAGLLATQVKQLHFQNIGLITLSDMMADEIRLLDKIAVMDLEGYAVNVRDSLEKRLEMYGRHTSAGKSMF
jgi:hypothetical protein